MVLRTAPTLLVMRCPVQRCPPVTNYDNTTKRTTRMKPKHYDIRGCGPELEAIVGMSIMWLLHSQAFSDERIAALFGVDDDTVSPSAQLWHGAQWR